MGRSKIVHKKRKVFKLKRVYLGLTNYQRRKDLLKSGKSYISVFKGKNQWNIMKLKNGNLLDIIEYSMCGKHLRNLGWKRNLVTRLALYLLGYWFGLNHPEKEEHLVNMGVYKSNKAGRIWALIKGVKDSGFPVRVNDSVLPSEDLIVYSDDKKKELLERFKKEMREKINKK